MAQKLSINRPPAVERAGKTGKLATPNRMPAVVVMLTGALAVAVFSFTQVARVSPKRGEVSGIAAELRKEHSRGSSALPNRVDPTRGTRLWMKKDGRG